MDGVSEKQIILDVRIVVLQFYSNNLHIYLDLDLLCGNQLFR